MNVDIALDWYAISDKGLKRRANEDACLCRPEGLFVVADGMGGANCGDIASQLTVNVLETSIIPYLLDEEATIPFEHSNNGDLFLHALKHAAEQANEAVLKSVEENQSCRGMGSTLTAAVLREGFIYVVHVGDSRCYQYNNGELDVLTRDHTRVREMVERNLITAEEARIHPKRHIITQCIGRKNRFKPDLLKLEHFSDVLYMICSDGLYDMLGDDVIKEILHQNQSLEHMGKQLVERANKNGGKDNITAVLFRQSPDLSDGVMS